MYIRTKSNTRRTNILHLVNILTIIFNAEHVRPFMFRVVTDGDELSRSIDYMNRGYHLNYHQLPCAATV